MSCNRLVIVSSILCLALSAAPAVRGEEPLPRRRGVGVAPLPNIDRLRNGDAASQRAMVRMNHLGRPEVQQDLKLSDEQKQKIDPIVEQARADRQSARPPRGQPYNLLEQGKLTAAWEEKAKASWTEVSKILTKEQAQRLEQITVQWGGVRILWNENEEVANTLQLTAEQRQKLTAISGELGKKMDALGRDNNDERAKLEQELVDRCIAVLTDEQRFQLAEMQGEKLKLQGPSGEERSKTQPQPQ